MAKKLVYDYTIDASASKISVKENHRIETLLIITDITIGKILYKFASPDFGYVSSTYNSTTEYTEIVLEQNLSGLGVQNTDKLQIFFEEQHTSIEPARAIVDPVHKLRVSQPQNLIDTDFEYGLQSTKWETLETVNNVPSIFSNAEDGIQNVQSVSSTASSNAISVITAQDHGLVVGTPIDVQGLDSATAEGKYVIKSVPTTSSFTYQAKSVQSTTGVISGVYTQIIPGEFYTASELVVSNTGGITTDQGSNSVLTITTEYQHGFTTGTQFYLLNTLGRKQALIADPTAAAPDGGKYSENTSTVTSTLNPLVVSSSNFKRMKSGVSFDFNASNSDGNNPSNITLTAHGLKSNDYLQYQVYGNDAPLSGLDRFEICVVKYVDDNTIQLSSQLNSVALGKTSPDANFKQITTGSATFDYGKHKLHLVYAISRVYIANNYQMHMYPHSYTKGNNGSESKLSGSYSGWQLKTTTGYGTGNANLRHMQLINDGGLASINNSSWPRHFWRDNYNGMYSAIARYPATGSRDYYGYMPFCSFSGKGPGTFYYKLDLRDILPKEMYDQSYYASYVRAQYALGRGALSSGNYKFLMRFWQASNFTGSNTAHWLDTINTGTNKSYFKITSANAGGSILSRINVTKPYLYISIEANGIVPTGEIDGMDDDINWEFVPMWYFQTTRGTDPFGVNHRDFTTSPWFPYPEKSGRSDGLGNNEPGYYNYYNDARGFGYGRVNWTNTHYQGTSSGYVRHYQQTDYDTSPDWNNQAQTTTLYDTGLFAVPLYDEDTYHSLYWQNHGLETNDTVVVYNLDDQIVLEDATASAGDRLLVDGIDGDGTASGNFFSVESSISTSIKVYTSEYPNYDLPLANRKAFSPQPFSYSYRRNITSSSSSWQGNQDTDIALRGEYLPTKIYGGKGTDKFGNNATSSSSPAVTAVGKGAPEIFHTGEWAGQEGLQIKFEEEIPSGTSCYVEKVNDNYIRLLVSAGGTSYRLRTAEGVYKLVADKSNPLQGSFYASNHGFTSNTGVIFNNSGGGSYPTIDSIGTYYTAFNSWAKNLMVDTVSSKWDHDVAHNNINPYDVTSTAGNENFYMQYGTPSAQRMFSSNGRYWYARMYHPTVGNKYGGPPRFRQGNAVWNPWISSAEGARDYGTASDYNEYMGANNSDKRDGAPGIGTANFQENAGNIKYATNTKSLNIPQNNLWTILCFPPKKNSFYYTAFGAGYLQMQYSEGHNVGAAYPTSTGSGWSYNIGNYPAHTGNSATGWTNSRNHQILAAGMKTGSITDVQIVLEQATTSYSASSPDYLVLDTAADAGDHIMHEDISLGNFRFCATSHQLWGHTNGRNTIVHIDMWIDNPTDMGSTDEGHTGLGVTGVFFSRYFSSGWGGSNRQLTSNSSYSQTYGANYIHANGLLTVNNGVKLAKSTVEGVMVQFMQDFMENVQVSPPAFNNTDTYYVDVVDDNRFKLKTSTAADPLLISTTGSGEFTFTSAKGEMGSNDGAFEATAVGANSVSVTVPFKVLEREIEWTEATFQQSVSLFDADNHGLTTGQALVYNNGGNTDVTGLSNGTVYYAIATNNDQFGVAASYAEATTNQTILIENITGTHSFTSERIDGKGKGQGTVTVSELTKVVTGSETLFKRYFLPGDTFSVKDTTQTPNIMTDFIIDSVTSDTSMKLTEIPTFTAEDTEYVVKTKFYTRPSGSFIHRSFDGGVEIKAGKSPKSVITRQTRKYFRYQSGKGIQCSLAINFNPPNLIKSLQSAGSATCTLTTQYPHGITAGCGIKVEGVTNDSAYNGSFTVASITDEFTFTYTAGSTPTSTTATGEMQFHAINWNGALVRGGMFDSQNGFFYEFDGTDLWAVRRSSTLQISGTATLTKKSQTVTGTNTSWNSTLTAGDSIVIRGQTYQVVHIASNTSMTIQPAFRGSDVSGVIITKTVDTRVKSADWSIDPCDGTGPNGYILDTTKIQMVYFDYAWYGAGKIRFGFKDWDGEVTYTHEFVHNNRLTEAYFRAGNLPGRYEIENTGNPTYIPNLFHWGTSIIMDGTFDDDEAYLFTANSNTLNSTNGQSNTSTTNATTKVYRDLGSYNWGWYDWYYLMPFPTADASKLTPGSTLFSNLDETSGSASQNAANLAENNRINLILQNAPYGNIIDYTQYSGSSTEIYVYAGNYRWPGPTDPSIGNSSPFSIGADIAGTGGTGNILDLTQDSPLVSIRLAPSVDSGIPGLVGEREIINRMQLKLKEIGIVTTHDSEIGMILNGTLDNNAWQRANQPSLSQYIAHSAGDKVTGGSKIYSFRASGGQFDWSTGKIQSNSTDFNLAELSNLGNSILGGNNTFPDGPDIITITVRPIDTNNITADGQFSVSGRLSWSESQA